MIEHIKGYYTIYKELIQLSNEVDGKINQINKILDSDDVELQIKDLEQEIVSLKEVINFKINELNKLRDNE